jgi:hypothetical protein
MTRGPLVRILGSFASGAAVSNIQRMTPNGTRPRVAPCKPSAMAAARALFSTTAVSANRACRRSLPRCGPAHLRTQLARLARRFFHLWNMAALFGGTSLTTVMPPTHNISNCRTTVMRFPFTPRPGIFPGPRVPSRPVLPRPRRCSARTPAASLLAAQSRAYRRSAG